MALTQVEPPVEVLGRSTLDRVDYADTFLVDGGAGPSLAAEAWGRSVLEGAPLATRLKLLAGWSSLGLHLGRPGSAGTVLGWPIVESADDHLLLAADSPLGLHGQLLFEPRPGGLVFATLLRLDHPAARLLWANVAPRHVRMVASLLRRAGEDASGSSSGRGASGGSSGRGASGGSSGRSASGAGGPADG